ncbi:putative uncharacterized protein DDB_G0277255 [Bradysia coprophila]|uniref:putative uncharacterized protein DDB_G0277255 n=1 Tax=Bradysia coprophila TaxID=38358 RepID=UPI00187DBB71|nr:putative uncharacterized protein DDB_G0277255 [Bradysia coprophila]
MKPHWTSAQLNVSSNDSFVSSLIEELKTINLGNNVNSLDGVFSLLGDSSKQSTNNSGQSNGWSKLPLWGDPQSPTPSIKTQYHSASSHTNSKESLWHSTQSSPNSNLREQSQSSTSQTCMWENPITNKITQPSLNYCKDPIGSIWTSPTAANYTQTNQSTNNSNKMSNIWETSTPNSTMSSYGNGNAGTAFNQSIKSDGNQVNVNNSHRLVRPQDISCDVWSNHNGALGVNKAKEPVGSLWATPTTNSIAGKGAGNMNNNKNTTKPIVKCLNFGTSSAHSNLVTSSTTTVSNSNATNSITNNNNQQQQPQSTAASSCLQLFSDEFLNYLNMIN